MRTDHTPLDMVRGDSLYLEIEADKTELNVSAVAFTVKVDRTTADIVFQKTLTNGITKTADGFQVRIAPTDTKNLEPGYYYYDLQLTIGSDVVTPLIGELKIEQDVTWS